MWFRKGVPIVVVNSDLYYLKDAIPAEINTSIDSIFKFAKEHMDPVEDKESSEPEKSGESVTIDEELSFVCSMHYLLE